MPEDAKWFGREPALVIAAIAALLSLLGGFGWSAMPDGTVAAITAVLTAGAGVWTAIHTRPVVPSLFTGFISASATLLAAFGLDLSQQQVGMVAAAAAALMAALVTRPQVTPVHDPSTTAIGPVR